MKEAPEEFVYVAEFLSDAEQASVLHEVRALTYTHDTFRGQIMKRAWAQFGFEYVSIGQKLTPASPIPAFLQAVIHKARPYYPNDSRFEQCIVTHYEPGSGIGWHTDAQRFGDCILGVSLAAPARLQFRPNKSQAVSYEVTPAPGSLYVLQGISRWHYQHRLVPVKAERYSLTFRSVAQLNQSF
jgi:alkylated DNA repair dioxygenase AlkB